MDLDAESDAIFIVRRLEVDDLRRAYIEPISTNVEMQLMSAINELQRLEKIDLYRAFVSIDGTKGVALCMNRWATRAFRKALNSL
jgi:hypothetical protein